MTVYEGRFRIQVFDVNAFAEASSLTLIRFMQQAATDASAAVGYPPGWYEQQGTLWLIRRTSLCVNLAARYDDELVVRTWVSDIRRVRSQREYEIRRSADSALIATSTSDWVYVDLVHETPIQPPIEMQAVLMPDGVRSQKRTARRLVPPDGVIATQRRIELGALDSVAHVNNAMYVTFIEQDLWDTLAAHGWAIDPTGRSRRPRLLSHDIEYLMPARYQDAIDGVVWVSEAQGETFTCRHILRRGDDHLVACESRWGWSEGPLPAALRQACEALRASG